MRVSYPRLPRALTLVEAGHIRDAMTDGGVPTVARLARVHHERQQPVSTGRIATQAEIEEVRSTVTDAMASQLSSGRVTDKAAFDRELGAALHANLNILPADASHEGTWNFLSAVVFPEIVAFRFPNVPDRRVLGGHRNVLRKTWIRHEILGDELLTLDLKEDELVGLFERTALVRNRTLVKLAAREVASRRMTQRDEWARKFYKSLTFQTGVRLLDVLDERALAQVVRTCAESADSVTLLPSEVGDEEE